MTGAVLVRDVTPAGATSLGNEAWWLVVIKVVVVFGVLVVTTILTIWAERRIVARMQQRSGPNRTGLFGSMQGLADGIKLMLKEDIIPALADKPVYVLAPILSAVPAFLAFSVIPFGPEVSVAGQRTALQLTDIPVGVLLVLACSSLGVYGIVLAGWASGSTYPLLGSLRSAAQMISYEVAMGLAIVPVFILSGTLSTAGIVGAQQEQGLWNVIPCAVAFGIYAIAVVGETNRAPFDLPEAESELVGGFHTEYSSIKFALFFLAEYINMVTVSALAVTLFLGGWLPPPIPFLSSMDSGWWPLLWFGLKVGACLFMFIWLRGTLPRLRYDQFMSFGWKVLVPIAVVYVLLVDAVRVVDNDRSTLVPVGIGAFVILGLLVTTYLMVEARKQSVAELAAPAPTAPLDPRRPGTPGAPVIEIAAERALPPGPGGDVEREEVSHV